MTDYTNYPRYKRPESILVVVYTASAQVLLLRRRQPANFWQSVTGALEWGEDTRQAAARELKEETGLSSEGLEDCHQVHTFEIYPRWRHLYAPGTIKNREFVFRLCVSGPVCPVLDHSEHDAYLWLSKEQALARVSSYTNRDAIRQWVLELDQQGGALNA